MYFFGHLGIGLKLVKPWNKGLPTRYILLGAILPDLIDKPLYYGSAFLTGRRAADIGLISGTRTFGHTAILALLLAGIANWRRSRAWAALTLGVGTHLMLDNLGDWILDPGHLSLRSLLWPADGWDFPVYAFHSLGDQLHRAFEPFFLIAEIVGLALLGWEIWKNRHRRDIVTFWNARRLRKSKTDR